MKPWRVLTSDQSGGPWREVRRTWTEKGAEKWALAHQSRLLLYWRVGKWSISDREVSER